MSVLLDSSSIKIEPIDNGGQSDFPIAVWYFNSSQAGDAGGGSLSIKANISANFLWSVEWFSLNNTGEAADGGAIVTLVGDYMGWERFIPMKKLPWDNYTYPQAPLDLPKMIFGGSAGYIVASIANSAAYTLSMKCGGFLWDLKAKTVPGYAKRFGF